MTRAKNLPAVLSVLFVAACLLSAGAATASALTPGVGWNVSSTVFPTHVVPGGEGLLQINLENAGASRSSGPVTVTDVLPPGVTAVASGGMEFSAAEILTEGEESKRFGEPRWRCAGTTVVRCTSNPSVLPTIPVIHNGFGELQFAERIGIKVAVGPAGVLTNQITVTGGGATQPTTIAVPLVVSSSAPPFGFGGWDASFTNADGTLDTQAGSHPYDSTFFLSFNQLLDHSKRAGGDVRNLRINVPPGLFGDPGAVPRCTRAQLDGQECPASTQIGIDQAGLTSHTGGGAAGLEVLSLFNMVPPPGVPVQFAFSILGIHAFFDLSVSNHGADAVVAHVTNVPRAELADNILTLWGVPADPSHDVWRHSKTCEFGCSSGVPPKPFLTLPTSCSGPLQFAIAGLGAYSDPTAFAESQTTTHDRNGAPTGLSGCEKLTVSPSLVIAPETSAGDSASGMTVDLTVGQGGLTAPEGLVAATLKNETVSLPAGIAVNPGQAAGLLACQPAEANLEGEGPSSCPPGSRVGTVRVKSPLLDSLVEPELEGNVYVLPSNPPNLQLLITASGDGVYLKLVGKVQMDEATGQLTTTFTETPELPFTDLKLTFAGGAQAALVTPLECGTYQTQGAFTPWTTPFGQDVSASSFFSISSGPGGSPCVATPPFTPSVAAGTSSTQAGAFTDFSLLFQGADGQQRPSTLTVKAPPGLAGMISKVTQCQEPQAAEGTCPAASQIGHVIATAGPGQYPLVIPQPGRPQAPIYLTGPYKGAPFGLSIATPIIAGPFNLGTIVVRARIDVDPHTARVTVTSDPLPQIVKGVPTHLRTLDAVIDRSGFMFNPTNCDSLFFSGQATGSQGASAPISSRFQAANCAALAFKPVFTASTQAATSKKSGASLHVKLTYPKASFGSQANIASVHVELPKALPSRLSTLNHACLDSVFNQDPASCPSQSRVGFAKAVTPVLPVPLEGPAYFVSHGGERFPELIVVLQGYGVTVYLEGETFISKAGITSSTFKSVPDVPVNTFELTLPQGPFSALAANTDLCTANLAMPTTFDAQNGATLKQSTSIEVENCPYALRIAHRSVSNHTFTLGVSVPQAGRLTASGKGVSEAAKTAKGRSTLTLTLKEGRAGKLRTKVLLRFTPAKGKQRKILRKSITVTFP